MAWRVKFEISQRDPGYSAQNIHEDERSLAPLCLSKLPRFATIDVSVMSTYSVLQTHDKYRMYQWLLSLPSRTIRIQIYCLTSEGKIVIRFLNPIGAKDEKRLCFGTGVRGWVRRETIRELNR